MRGTPRELRLLIAAGVALFSTTAVAAPPVTLQEALRIFRASAFDLLLADTATEAARADLITAGTLPNPTISASRGTTSGYDPNVCAGCSNRAVSVGASDLAISDIASGRRKLRETVARAALDAAVHSRADVERNLELTLKQQLLQAELTQKSLEFARQTQELSGRTFALTKKRYDAGAISEVDVARADVQRLEADQAVDAVSQALLAAKSQVAFLLATRDLPEVGDDLIRTFGQVAVAREALLQRALAQRPDLAAARAQIARAQSSLALARRLRIPDFSPSLQYSQEGRGQSAIQPPTVTLGVSLPVPLFDRQRGEIARARADLRAQEVTRDKIESQVAADVTTSIAAFETARSRAVRLQTQLLPQAARARDLVGLQYEKGAASLFEFLDAQRTFLAAQNEYLQSLNDYWTAVFQMEQAAGMELH
jgi:cobalt-zinc-cadmium efflux system outer membrane protein